MVLSLRMGRGWTKHKAQTSKGHIHSAISRARITQLFIIKPTSEKGGKFSVSSAKRKQLGLPDARKAERATPTVARSKKSEAELGILRSRRGEREEQPKLKVR